MHTCLALKQAAITSYLALPTSAVTKIVVVVAAATAAEQQQQ